MKKLLLYIVLTLGVIYTDHAQFIFNYHDHFDSIASLTKQKGENSYDELRYRFETADTSFTNFDALVLMIGETQQSHYYPYDLIFVEHEIMDLANKGDYESTLKKCDSLLAIHPANLTALIHKAFLEDKLGSLTAAESKLKFLIMLDAIMASGDGTKNAPIMVIGPADGQLLIRYVFGAGIGTMGSGSDEYGNFLDILEIVKEGEEPTNMYFVIEHAVKRMFKEDTLKEFEKTFKKELKKADKKNKKKSKSSEEEKED